MFQEQHDDVIKWKLFPRNLHFLRGIHRSLVGEFPTQRSVTQSLDVFFDLRLNKRLSKTIVRLVIWDAIASMMTSLLWSILLTPFYEGKGRYIHSIGKERKLFLRSNVCSWYSECFGLFYSCLCRVRRFQSNKSNNTIRKTLCKSNGMLNNIFTLFNAAGVKTISLFRGKICYIDLLRIVHVLLICFQKSSGNRHILGLLFIFNDSIQSIPANQFSNCRRFQCDF